MITNQAKQLHAQEPKTRYQITTEQQAVFNNHDIMIHITSQAKRTIANQLNTTVEHVELGIIMNHDNNVPMMCQLVREGVTDAAKNMNTTE